MEPRRSSPQLQHILKLGTCESLAAEVNLFTSVRHKFTYATKHRRQTHQLGCNEQSPNRHGIGQSFGFHE